MHDEHCHDEDADRTEKRREKGVVPAPHRRKDGEEEHRDARAETRERRDALPAPDRHERDREKHDERPQRGKPNDLRDRVRTRVPLAAEREQHAVARGEEAVLVQGTPTVPLELDDLASIKGPVELNRETLILRALVITRSEHAHDVRIDDLDPDAGVGIAAGDDGRRGRDEDDPTKQAQRTCRVAPTVVVRPASSITSKTRL